MRRMGRVKLKIKRLEGTSNRQVTYSKRRSGILKKAKELSILCDIDIVLLMFSPSGRPTLFHGEHSSNIEDVIAKFAQLTPQERTKRKLESLEALKKTFKKLDHDVNIHEFIGARNQTVEGLSNQVAALQAQITELHRRLSCWTNIDRIDNIRHLRQLEESLRESIENIQIHRENFRKNQFMLLDSKSQLQSGISLPFAMGGMQDTHSISWFPDTENQQMILSGDSGFLTHSKEMESATTLSLPVYSSFFGSVKLEDQICNPGQLDDLGPDTDLLNQLNRSEYSYPYMTSFGGVSVQEEQKLKPETELNLPDDPSMHPASTSFQLPDHLDMFGSDHHHHAWVPDSTCCSTSVFGQTSYNQQLN